MSVITDVPVSQLIDTHGLASVPFFVWLKQVFVICFAMQQSGTTANRPTTNLWVGRMYFDTTLGYPVWLKSAGPSVWVNGAGTVV